MASTVRLRLFNAVVNPVVRAVVRLRPHGRLARAVALLTYRGRISGRSFTIPVEYATDTDGSYLVVPGEAEHKTWWRNFRTPMLVTLLVAGAEITGKASLVEELGDRVDALAVYFRRFPLAARTQGLRTVERTKLGRIADRIVVVRVDAGA